MYWVGLISGVDEPKPKSTKAVTVKHVEESDILRQTICLVRNDAAVEAVYAAEALQKDSIVKFVTRHGTKFPDELSVRYLFGVNEYCQPEDCLPN